MSGREYAGGRVAGLAVVGLLALGLVATGCASAGSATRAQPAPEDSANVGYGSAPRRLLTGAVQSIVIPDSVRMRYSRVEEMLVGRVPGLQMIALPNGGYALRLRGTISIEGNNEPLIIVDGLPMGTYGEGNTLAEISPIDVERIDIIKDAGTAIYGERGAAGVIVITTRRGRRAGT